MIMMILAERVKMILMMMLTFTLLILARILMMRILIGYNNYNSGDNDNTVFWS